MKTINGHVLSHQCRTAAIYCVRGCIPTHHHRSRVVAPVPHCSPVLCAIRVEAAQISPKPAAAPPPKFDRWPRPAPLRDSVEQLHATIHRWVARVARARHVNIGPQLSVFRASQRKSNTQQTLARGRLAAAREIASTRARTDARTLGLQ